MLLVEGSSEAGSFRQYSNHVFRSLEFRKYISYEGHPFFQFLQNLIWISKMQKKIDKNVFHLLDNCICIGCVEISLLKTGFLSLAVNMLTISPKILHITKRDFFQLNFLHSDQ